MTKIKLKCLQNKEIQIGAYHRFADTCCIILSEEEALFPVSPVPAVVCDPG